jgi:hypothetical protein
LLVQVKQNELALAQELENFGYNERVERLEGGNTRSTEEFEVTNYKGRRIRRLIARNNEPLRGQDLEKENRRTEKLIHRMEKGDIPPLTNRRLRTEDLIAAASFSHVRTETWHGREVRSCQFSPRPGYRPQNINERLILNLRGELRVDPATLQIVGADFQLTGSLKIAGGLFFNMKPGTKFREEQTFFDNRIWLPKSSEVTFLARALLAKSLNLEVKTTYSGYRRFDVSATSGNASAAAPPR